VQQIGRDVVAARELIGNYESLRELDPLHGIRGPA